jgi:hypothetical protein
LRVLGPNWTFAFWNYLIDQVETLGGLGVEKMVLIIKPTFR